jgi:TonB family protein
VSVTKSLDAKFGLDDEAIKAAKQWRFSPSKKDGKAVAAWMVLKLEFRLAADQQ